MPHLVPNKLFKGHRITLRYVFRLKKKVEKPKKKNCRLVRIKLVESWKTYTIKVSSSICFLIRETEPNTLRTGENENDSQKRKE